MTTVDFARLRMAGNTKQKKQCKKGYSCGFSCIQRGAQCRNPLDGQAKDYAGWMAGQAGGAIVLRNQSGLQGKAGVSQEPPKGKKESNKQSDIDEQYAGSLSDEQIDEWIGKTVNSRRGKPSKKQPTVKEAAEIFELDPKLLGSDRQAFDTEQKNLKKLKSQLKIYSTLKPGTRINGKIMKADDIANLKSTTEAQIRKRESFVEKVLRRSARAYLYSQNDLGVLGLEGDLTVEKVKTAYRLAARKSHPDVGGTQRGFERVNEAYNRMKERLNFSDPPCLIDFSEPEDEREQSLDQREQALAKRIEDLTKRDRQARYSQYSEMLTPFYENGQIASELASKSDLAEFMTVLSNHELCFSEGVKQSSLDWFKNFLIQHTTR